MSETSDVHPPVPAMPDRLNPQLPAGMTGRGTVEEQRAEAEREQAERDDLDRT